MNYDIGLLLDGLILVFLCVTIFYAARLSMFLKVFREGKTGMEVLIRDLSVTINKAETAIRTMKIHAQETQGELRDIVNQAKSLSDELGFMNETGDNLANRLEKLADRNRELVDLMENAGGIGTQKITPYDPRSNDARSDIWAKPKASKQQAPQKYIEAEDDFEISDFDIDEDDERDFMALGDGAYKAKEPEHHSKVNVEAKSKVRSFAIFDREHGDDKDGDIEIKNDLARPYEFEEEDEREFPSAQKEREFHSQAEQDLYEALQRKKKMQHKVSQVS